MPVPLILAGAGAVAARLAAKKAAQEIAKKAAMKAANTKAGVKVTKTVAKKVQAQAVKQNKKTVNKIADIQQKTKADKIANNSVKSIPAGSKPRTKTASELAELNKNVKKGKAYSKKKK